MESPPPAPRHSRQASLPDLEAYINARRTSGRRQRFARGAAGASMPPVQARKPGAKRAKLKSQRLK